MANISQTPEIIKLALEQNKITAPDNLSEVNFPIRLADLANQIKKRAAKTLNIAGIQIDLEKKTAKTELTIIDLTAKEAELINFLSSVESADKQNILEKVWGYSADTNTKTVETHLHRLNSKFQESFGQKITNLESGKYILTTNPKLIKT